MSVKCTVIVFCKKVPEQNKKVFFHYNHHHHHHVNEETEEKERLFCASLEAGVLEKLTPKRQQLRTGIQLFWLPFQDTVL